MMRNEPTRSERRPRRRPRELMPCVRLSRQRAERVVDRIDQRPVDLAAARPARSRETTRATAQLAAAALGELGSRDPRVSPSASTLELREPAVERRERFGADRPGCPPSPRSASYSSIGTSTAAGRPLRVDDDVVAAVATSLSSRLGLLRVLPGWPVCDTCTDALSSIAYSERRGLAVCRGRASRRGQRAEPPAALRPRRRPAAPSGGA